MQVRLTVTDAASGGLMCNLRSMSQDEVGVQKCPGLAGVTRHGTCEWQLGGMKQHNVRGRSRAFLFPRPAWGLPRDPMRAHSPHDQILLQSCDRIRLVLQLQNHCISIQHHTNQLLAIKERQDVANNLH
jgi:hypothetical protein